MKTILQNDIASFIHKSFANINQSIPFIQNWHIELISEYLLLVYFGKIKRLIINIPPRCLKSFSTSIAWPAWLLQRNPNLKIILTTYSQILTNKNFNEVNLILKSNWYNQYFPHVKINHQIKNRITTSDNGFIYATSTGGTLTGEGGDIFIIDDPHNPAHLNSIKLQNKVIDWYEQVLYSRLNNPKDSKIVIVMQRLHLNDLTGHLLKNQDWTILNIPIIAKENLYYKINDFAHEYQKGNLLDSNRFSYDAIDKIKNNVGIANWQAQYMQAPIAKAGIIEQNMIIKEDIANLEFEFIIQSWDTAVKIDANSDFSVCVTFGILKDKYYVIDIYQEKLTYPKLKEKSLFLLNQYHPCKILIEDKSSGQSLIQDLNSMNIKNIVAIKPSLNKNLRLALNLEFFFNKQIIFNQNIKKEYIEELLIFPFSKHDDIIDAISQFLDFIKKNNNITAKKDPESLIR